MYLNMLITVVAVINTNFGLFKEGVKKNMLDLLLPSIITFFGTSVIGNCVERRFYLNLELILLFIVGFYLSLKIQSVPIIFEYIPLFGKTLFYMNLEDNFDTYKYLLSLEVISLFINKIMFKKTMKLQENDFRPLISILGLKIVNFVDVPRYFVIIFILLAKYLSFQKKRGRKKL